MLQVSTLALALALGAPATTPIDDLRLVMTPSESTRPAATALAAAFGHRSVRVEPFDDARDSTWHVGRYDDGLNTREHGRNLTVSTHGDVAGFCRAQLVELLRGGGVPVVETGGDLVLSGAVERFFVEEDEKYVGSVTLDLKVADPAGKVLWSGKAIGFKRKWGRSFKADNYMETLSDALLTAFTSWAETSALVEAVNPPQGAR
jgi:hypothetical protein